MYIYWIRHSDFYFLMHNYREKYLNICWRWKKLCLNITTCKFPRAKLVQMLILRSIGPLFLIFIISYIINDKWHHYTCFWSIFFGSGQKLSPLCFMNPLRENQPFIRKCRKTLLSALNKPHYLHIVLALCVLKRKIEMKKISGNLPAKFQNRINFVSMLLMNFKTMFKWNKIQCRIISISQNLHNVVIRHCSKVETTLHNVDTRLYNVYRVGFSTVHNVILRLFQVDMALSQCRFNVALMLIKATIWASDKYGFSKRLLRLILLYGKINFTIHIIIQLLTNHWSKVLSMVYIVIQNGYCHYKTYQCIIYIMNISGTK